MDYYGTKILPKQKLNKIKQNKNTSSAEDALEHFFHGFHFFTPKYFHSVGGAQNGNQIKNSCEELSNKNKHSVWWW